MHRSICCELLLARPDIFSQDTQSLVFQPAKSVVKGRIWLTLDKDALGGEEKEREGEKKKNSENRETAGSFLGSSGHVCF